MSKNKNQTGFTAVETILVLVFVILIGVAGYFVWHSQHAAKKVVNLSGTTTTTKPTSTFLAIKEWGVKVKIPYVTNPEYILVKGNQAFLTSQAEKNDPNCHEIDGTSPDFPTYVAIVRALPTDAPIFGDDPGADAPKTVQAMGAKYNNVTTVGNYDYYILKGNGIPCNDTATHALDDNIANQLRPVIQTSTAAF